MTVQGIQLAIDVFCVLAVCGVCGIGLYAMWRIVRAQDMAQAEICKRHAAQLLGEADKCRAAAASPKVSLTTKDRDQLVEHARELTACADWWTLRAEQWEKGDI